MINTMTDHNKSKFRADINGLRAWAVAAVFFFHFGIPGFRGGFVGVDVFFVISGFLMTGLVVSGLERGVFSVWSFYLGRARRIVPALLALCALLLALGWWVLLSPVYKMLSSHAVYALTFLSNIEFWQEAGYFDVASHEKWLLHTWSLSVEWQFYLVLPLVLWLAWRVKPGRAGQLWVVAIGFALSLAASVWTTQSAPGAAFYLLHTRAWEMLGGGLVYLLGHKWVLSQRQRQAMELGGLLLIGISVLVFDKTTAWPGWRAMIPVMAAALVLAANRASFWTAGRLPQWIGDRSYSLYLWHWPIFVALLYVQISANPLAIAAGLALTLVLGHLSYVWVEQPSRKLLQARQHPAAAGVLLLAAAVVVVPALAIWKMQGITGRFAQDIELAAAETNNFNPRRAECHPSKGTTSPSCVYGGATRDAVVMGDSHAAALITGVAQAGAASGAGIVEWTYSGCQLVPGMNFVNRDSTKPRIGDDCAGFVQWAMAEVAKLPPGVPVIIAGRYAQNAFGSNEDGDLIGRPRVYFSKIYERADPAFLAEFSQRITDAACQIARQRPVYLLRPIPEMGFDVPKTLSRRMVAGLKNDLSIPLADYQKRNAWVWEAQDKAHAQCGAKILDPTAYLCHDGRCMGSLNNRPLYHDDDHLSEFGNKLLVPMYAEVFTNGVNR